MAGIRSRSGLITPHSRRIQALDLGLSRRIQALELGEHFVGGPLHPVSLLAQDFILHLHPMVIVEGFGNPERSRRSQDRPEHD